MSSTMVFPPIVGALVKSEEILGQSRLWSPVNEAQGQFLPRFFLGRTELSRFSEKELQSWVSFTASELSEILAREGFSIKMPPFKPNEFGVVSILNVLVEWLKQGKLGEVLFNGSRYPAVLLEREPVEGPDGRRVSTYDVLTSRLHQYPVVRVATKSGDTVFMTIAGSAADGFELVSRVDALRVSIEDQMYHYKYLTFPMVALNQMVDISWLQGMYTAMENGNRAVIADALQQTKFGMNEFGARIESAVMMRMAVLGVSQTREVVIDKPFFLWIERPGVLMPIMYAYLDELDWKNPGSLSK